VINARSVKPLDEALILAAARVAATSSTIEENVVTGGFGAGVLELLSREGVVIPTHLMGCRTR
jgi:1-deoxy-D-xylulose-5-phosphate synthase